MGDIKVLLRCNQGRKKPVWVNADCRETSEQGECWGASLGPCSHGFAGAKALPQHGSIPAMLLESSWAPAEPELQPEPLITVY